MRSRGKKLAIIGVLTGIIGALLFLVEYVGTILGGLVHGAAIARSLGVRLASARIIPAALGGGIGFFLAFVTAIVMGRSPDREVEAWLPLLSFPLGGFVGAGIMSYGLRLSGVPLGGRTQFRYLLVGTMASYAVLGLAFLGIPIWQALTAAVLGELEVVAEEGNT